jgi:hypothetical protein
MAAKKNAAQWPVFAPKVTLSHQKELDQNTLDFMALYPESCEGLSGADLRWIANSSSARAPLGPAPRAEPGSPDVSAPSSPLSSEEIDLEASAASRAHRHRHLKSSSSRGLGGEHVVEEAFQRSVATRKMQKDAIGQESAAASAGGLSPPGSKDRPSAAKRRQRPVDEAARRAYQSAPYRRLYAAYHALLESRRAVAGELPDDHLGRFPDEDALAHAAVGQQRGRPKARAGSTARTKTKKRSAGYHPSKARRTASPA